MIDAPVIPDGVDLNEIQKGFVNQVMSQPPGLATLDPFMKFTDMDRKNMGDVQKAFLKAVFETQQRKGLK